MWVVFDWWTTSGGPARPIVRTYTISGKVELGDWGGDVTAVPIVVQLRNAGSTDPLRTVTHYVDSAGNYSLPDVPNGNYDLAFKASHWLRKVVRNVRVSGAKVGGVNASLTNGDNEVTLLDFGGLVAAFGSVPGDSNWNPDADLDGDAEVTLFDFGVLVRHFGEIGDE
ncbi:MAG: carboxypeptidase-like regulatory domain-containing protein [Firmicutes bacterium]|nr:carboxypeptidase-like regulatory domain-containing protein [Bacillota bacterium]